MQASSFFSPIHVSNYNMSVDALSLSMCSTDVYKQKDKLLRGNKVLWGIPFELGPESGNNLVYLDAASLDMKFQPVAARFLIFVHATDMSEPVSDQGSAYSGFRGPLKLGEKVCEYIVHYADGQQCIIAIRSRMEINDMVLTWGKSAYTAVSHERGGACPTVNEALEAGQMPGPGQLWGRSQYRAEAGGETTPFKQWLYAWENPMPNNEITGIEIRHCNGRLFWMGVTAGHTETHPLRYNRREKLALPLEGDSKNPLALVDIDLGHIISVHPRAFYENSSWEQGYNNQQPDLNENEYILEFCAHKDACLYLGETRTPLFVRDLPSSPYLRIPSAEQPVTLRVLDPEGKPTAVKVHAHGIGGEYLPPRNRHRVPNPYFFEDYSVDFVHGPHWCTYIDGTAEYLLPQGEVFFEVAKGFEISPVRRRFEISPDTSEIVIQLERVLDWRKLGWVTADTHVHFLSPRSALLEGEGEGVNLVALLASQWGEMFSNIGDFDGDSVVSKNNDYMVSVGTENRQQILGHISLIGYEGAMILPLTTGGPEESALGDPVETTLSQWAQQSKAQSGINIIPHFPNPRGEAAAAIVSNLIDGVEMTSWNQLYMGISPYALSDWYSYLNCGYQVAIVGGTDKMSAATAVGTVRTYAKVDGLFSLDTWKEAVKKGRTFVSYGALADICVEGKYPGGQIDINGEATLQVDWSVASATIPISAVEIVVGGETQGSKSFSGMLGSSQGSFTVKVSESTWIALRVRGQQVNKPEIIIAHTSAVMVTVRGKSPLSAPDAVAILEQIEGVTAYVKTIGTRANEKKFKQILMALTSAHRALHNRLHEQGFYHKHTIADEHHHE